MEQGVKFIVNPKSGIGSKKDFPKIVSEFLSKKYSSEIVFTSHAGHATQLSHEAVAQGFKYVVAVGGDGTVNETAQGLVNTDAVLGIIPRGSGNGLARHLKIPLAMEKAVEFLFNEAREVKMDTAEINGKAFFCTAGVGFDAHIGHAFAMEGTRGFQTYLKTSLREFLNYKPEKYHVKVNNEEFDVRAFLVTIANTSQYGNNACISPEADVQDGLLDVCILRPFPKYAVVDIGRRLFNQSMHKSRYMQLIKTRELTITREEDGPAHLDGEPLQMSRTLNAKIHPLSLNVLAGNC